MSAGVLAVMLESEGEQAYMARSGRPTVEVAYNADYYARQREARATVAELIEAGEHLLDQTRIVQLKADSPGPIERFRAALATARAGQHS